VSLYSVVSRGVVGRLVPRPSDPESDPATAAAGADPRIPSVRLQGASMRFLEAALALTAIATAILIGAGR
jgi:hypothetical protein